MANRTTYRDLGLVFAREPEHQQTSAAALGDPMPPSHLGDRQFKKLPKAAGVRRIKFHGLRHTSATLALGNGEPVHLLAERLGHKHATTPLAFYAARCRPGSDVRRTGSERCFIAGNETLTKGATSRYETGWPIKGGAKNAIKPRELLRDGPTPYENLETQN